MTAIEKAAESAFTSQLVAEGMAEHEAEVLVRREGDRKFMVEVRLLDVTDADEGLAGEVPFADDYEISRHAEKQGCSWADAWRHFEREGYDMTRCSGQYQ